MRYKFILAVVLAVLTTCSQIAAQSPVLKPGDLDVLEGGIWTGTLAYIDYSTNKKTLINSAIQISRSKSDKTAWIFDYRYPLEPKANQVREVRLSADGKGLDGETVIERSKLPNAGLRIVTTKRGRDNDRDAEFKYTYIIGPRVFIIRKDVKVNETDGYFERNTYSWTR